MVMGPTSTPGKSVVDAVASALRNFGSLDLTGGALAQVISQASAFSALLALRLVFHSVGTVLETYS